MWFKETPDLQQQLQTFVRRAIPSYKPERTNKPEHLGSKCLLRGTESAVIESKEECNLVLGLLVRKA